LKVNENTLIAEVSQSAQWAVSTRLLIIRLIWLNDVGCLQPFNRAYLWLNTSDNMIIRDPSTSEMNTFTGGGTQQATSVVTNTNASCYELDGGCYSVYGFEVLLSDVCGDVTLTPFTVSTRYLNLEIIEV
jgi:hypothetical protein